MKEKTPINSTTPVPTPSAAISAEAHREGPSTTEPSVAEPSPLVNDRAKSGMAVSLGPDADEHEEAAPSAHPKMRARNISVFYGEKQALKDVSIDDAKFGVKAIGIDGSESLVTPYAYPPRTKTEIETVQ